MSQRIQWRTSTTSCFRRALLWIAEFSSQTTIHGLNFVGIQKLHVLERLFWISVVLLGTGGAIAISLSNWRRFLANPTVVSLQKDYRNWHNPFPAVTCCSIKRVDPEMARKYIKRHWNVDEGAEKFDYLMDFVKATANLNYSSMHEMRRFANDSLFRGIDLEDLLVTVHPKLSGTLVTFDPKRKYDWTMIMTEMGICFTVNSKFSKIFAIRTEGGNNTQEEDLPTLRCNYLNGLCYARYDSDPLLPLNYYVHSYLDILHATIEFRPLLVRESQELEINFQMQETGAAQALRSLSPQQRQCRFDDEPPQRGENMDLLGDFSSPPPTPPPVYSTSVCYVACRHHLALSYCGCKPFFYNFLDGKPCDVAGLACLAKYADKITQQPSKLGCRCLQPCELVTYLRQVPKYTTWEYGYFDKRITFRWGLLSPTTKFRRDVLFGFEDLVVSFGGTLSLFLGMSFISLTETLFLILEILFRSRCCRSSTRLQDKAPPPYTC